MSTRYLKAGADFPRLLSHDYKPICVWCGKELTGRQIKYCSEECFDEVGIRCGVGVLYALFERDKGVCARCGCDCHRIKLALGVLQFDISRMARHRWERRGHLAAAIGLQPTELDKSLWEAHHKKAVKDGGGACGLDNFETVCVWCHKKETAGQAAAAAKVRRVEKQEQLPLLRKD